MPAVGEHAQANEAKRTNTKKKRKRYLADADPTTQGPARRGAGQRQGPAPEPKRSTRKQYLPATQGPARRGADQRQGPALKRHSPQYLEKEQRVLGQRVTLAEHKRASDFREQVGLKRLPSDQESVRRQAAAQEKFERQEALDMLKPTRLGLEIKRRARDDSPDEIANAARELQAAGVSGDAIREAINTLGQRNESFALTALGQLTRPISAVAGATRATYKGDNIAKGLVSGAIENDQSFSDVLADVGAPDWVQATAGLALDIALDPTSYLSLGTAVPAKVAAKGAQVAALKAGAKADEALRVAREVYDAHPLKGRGVQVGLRGTPVRAASTARHAVKTGSVRQGYGLSRREVKTTGRASSKAIGTPAKVAAEGLGDLPGAARVLDKADRARVELVNSARPRDVHPVDFDHARNAARKYRAARGAGERLAASRTKAYHAFAKAHAIGPAGLDRIATALDAGDLSHLKAGERSLAQILQRDLAAVAKREVAAGVRSGDAVLPNYWPRVMREKAKGAGSAGQRVTGASFKARKDRRALAEMTPEEAARYLTDDLEPVARRLGDHGRAMALATLHDEMAALGPVVRSLDEIDDAGGSLKTVYERDGKGYKRLWRDGEGFDVTRAKVADAIAHGREVRAIPESTHDFVFGQAQRGRASLDDGMLGQAFDVTQGRLKTLQTVVNPGYHITNLIGDLFNARVGGATFSEIKGAARQVRLTRKLDAFDGDVMKGIDDLTAARLTSGGKVERYGSNGELRDAWIVDLAREHGAIQTGFAGSELHALQRTEAAKAYRLDQRGLEAVRHANELREDLVRLVSFRSALKRGMTPEQASAHVTKHHIDYSDLTETERRFARRVVPFYTFARHNLPIQARGLAGSPGR